MTYIPTKSLRKALDSIRIVHNGAGDADIFVGDNPTPTNVDFSTLGDWVQIYSSTTQTVKALEIFDATGEVGKLASGAASSESTLFRIIPGGNGLNYFQIDGATRITLTYESAVPAAGSETIINFFF